VNVARQFKIFGALSVGALTIATQAFFPTLSRGAAGEPSPSVRPGSPAQFVIPLKADSAGSAIDLVLDDTTKRIFVTVEKFDAVQVFGYDGKPIGQVPLDRAGSLTNSPVGLFAIDEGLGSIVGIDPLTFATRTVAADLNTPRGLTFTDGSLFTVVSTGPLAADRELVKIDPVTGSRKSIAPNPLAIGQFFEHLMDPSPQPGMLFGTEITMGQRGFNKVEFKDPTSYVHVENDFTCEAALDNGEVLVARYDEFFALNPTTMSDALRRWPTPDNTYPESCAAAGGVAALTSRGIDDGSGAASTVVQVFDQHRPGQLLKNFRFNSGHLAGPTSIAADASFVVAPFRFGNDLELQVLTLLDVRGGPPVLGPGTPAIPVRIDPIFAQLASVDDWMISPDGQHVFAYGKKQGRVVVFDMNGAVVTSIDQLAQPSAMTVCDGVPSISLFGSSEVLTLDPKSSIPLVAFTGIPRVKSLSCVGSTVYAYSAPPRAKSGQAANVWTLTKPLKSKPFATTGATFARYGVADSLVANVGSNYGRYDPLTLSEFTPIDSYYPAGPLRPAQSLHSTVDGTKFFDYAGRQFDVFTLRPTGVQFPGTNVVISETTPAYVATRPTGANNILIMAGDDSSRLIRQLTISSAFVLLDLEFVPKSNTLFALVRRSADNEYFVRALPNVVTGVAPQTDPISIEMFAPVAPSRR
jgi:hypothetical protein